MNRQSSSRQGGYPPSRDYNSDDERIARNVGLLVEPVMQQTRTVPLVEPKSETKHERRGAAKQRRDSANKQIVTTMANFYRNPTFLSRLVLNQKHKSAIKRLRKTPSKATVWMCSRRKSKVHSQSQ